MKSAFRISITILAGIVLIWSPAFGFNLGGVTGMIIDKIEMPGPMIDQLGTLMYGIKLKNCPMDVLPKEREMAESVWAKLKGAAPYSDLYASANAEKWHWELALVNDRHTADAEAFPGGKVLVYSGCCAVAGGDQGRMAFILGHEMAHALARHAKARFDKRTKEAIVAAATGGTMNAFDLDPKITLSVMAAMGVAYEAAEVAPFAREQEAEADRNALLLMAQAGYDPQAAIDCLKCMQKACSTKTGGITHSAMADHPPMEMRLANLNEYLPRALEIYRKTGRAVQ